MKKPINVKRIRRKLNLTQKELAALVDVDPMTVWKWERYGFRPGAGTRRSRARDDVIRERLLRLVDAEPDGVKTTARAMVEKRRCPYCRGTGRLTPPPTRSRNASLPFCPEGGDYNGS